MHPIFLRACGLALLLVLAPGVWTCTYFDAFKDNKDGTVTDPRSNTVWQRCTVGQNWNGSACTGGRNEMPWWDAMRAARADRLLGKADWRLPTQNELVAIVGKHDDCKNTKPRRAVSAVFPLLNNGDLSKFWSSTPEAGTPDALLVNFDFGDAGASGIPRSLETGARFVRAGKSSASLEFNREFAKISQYEGAHLGSASTRRVNTATQQRSGDYGSINAASISSGDTSRIYTATCTEGGRAQVSEHRSDSYVRYYSSSGFSHAVRNTNGSDLSVEAAMRVACKGR